MQITLQKFLNYFLPNNSTALVLHKEGTDILWLIIDY